MSPEISIEEDTSRKYLREIHDRSNMLAGIVIGGQTIIKVILPDDIIVDKEWLRNTSGKATCTELVKAAFIQDLLGGRNPLIKRRSVTREVLKRLFK